MLADLQERYFEPAGAKRVFRKDLRRALIFGRHDLIQDAPISRIDLLASQHVDVLQRRDAGPDAVAVPLRLERGGYLFLGKAEMLLSRARLFTPVDLKRRVLAKVARAVDGERLLELPTGFDDAIVTTDERSRARDLALEASGVAHVVIDATGVVVFASDEARRLFGLSARHRQAVPGPRRGVPARRTAVAHRQAYAERQRVEVADVELTQPGGRSQWFDVRVQPLLDADSALLTPTMSSSRPTRSSSRPTRSSRRRTTSCVTGPPAELNEVNGHMQSILTGLRGAVVVDRDLHVRVWSRHAEDLWGLRPTEVADQYLSTGHRAAGRPALPADPLDVVVGRVRGRRRRRHQPPRP